jgi:hypothetical protein
MADNLIFTPSELALLNVPEDDFLLAVGKDLASTTYFEVEPSQEELKQYANDWIMRQFSRVRRYLCSDDIINKSTILPSSEAAVIILDIMRGIVVHDRTLLVSGFILLKYTVLFCVRLGLRKVCTSK